ncbi:tetratricopeptide repeat protein [Acidobacteria bacterium AB60]|nr:tetratricopeptide repeat protein [Acidobacteria bacterium AB60]
MFVDQVRFVILASILCAGPISAQRESEAARLAREGQEAMAQGQMEAAKSSFERLVALEPSIAEVHATLAAIDFKLKAYDEAVREIGVAEKLKPGLPRLDSLLGLSLAELGRFHDAIPKLEKGFKQTTDAPTRRMCGLQLLRGYTNLGRDSDAVQTALELQKLYPRDPEVLYHTGRIFGNYTYLTMEQLQNVAPDSVWMLQARGEANESQKNYDAAIDAFNHVLSLEPDRPGIHYRLGRVYLARFTENRNPADRDAATREFDAELEKNPRNGNALYELANLAAQSGDPSKARAGFEALVKQIPDFEEALVGLGGVLLDGSAPQEAVAPLQRATHIRPQDEVAWYRLAQAERAAGNREEQQRALEAFRKLHHSTPVGMRRPDEDQDITPQQLGSLPEN